MPRIEIKDETCNRVSQITGKSFTRGGDKQINYLIDVLQSQIKEASMK